MILFCRRTFLIVLFLEKGKFIGRREMSVYYAIGSIRFIKAPRGQAPLWVREAWVGLTIPCFPFIQIPQDGNLRGVEDGEAMPSYECVLASQKEALDALGQHNEAAAHWWRQNGFGSDSAPPFAFDTESFEIVSSVHAAEMIVYDDLETGHWEQRDSGR